MGAMWLRQWQSAAPGHRPAPFFHVFLLFSFIFHFFQPKCRRHATACAHKKCICQEPQNETSCGSHINWPLVSKPRSPNLQSSVLSLPVFRSRSPTDLHIDGAERNEKRLLKLIPHQSFNKRACRPSSKQRLRLDKKKIYICVYFEPTLWGLLKKVTHAHWF